MVKSKSTSSSLRDKAKRAQLSCYTCRQRKVKCDRVKPCSSCVQYQDPDGCRYDMSDDKRQPMLMADAYKQLRRENSELKAKEEGNQAMITEYKTENAALKARLAAFQIRNLQPSNCSASSNVQTRPKKYTIPHISTSAYPDFSEDKYEVEKTLSMFSKPIDSPMSQNSILPWGIDPSRSEDYHGSKALSQALKTANIIVSNVRRVQEPEDLLLQQAVQDLITVLGNLPNEFPFILEKVKGREISHRKISSQAILVSQTLHSHIITLLSFLGGRSTTSSRFSNERSIRLTEPLRQRLITSCFIILALLQYLNAQTNNRFSDSGICYQSHAALAAISQLDPAIEEDLFQIPLKHILALLHKQDIPRPAFPVTSAYTKNSQELDRHRPSQRIKVHKGSLSSNVAKTTPFEMMEHDGQAPIRGNIEKTCSTTWFANAEAPSVSQGSSTKEFALSGSTICHTSTPPYPGLASAHSQHKTQDYGLYSASYSSTIIGHERRDNGVPQIGQVDIFPVADNAKTFSNNYQHATTQYPHDNVGCLTWRIPIDQNRIDPGQEIDGIGVFVIPQLSNTMVYSTDITQFAVDDSYTSSVNTSSSSLQTPIQSHSVSPVSIQEQLNSFGSKSRAFDPMQQTFEDDRSFTNDDHE